VKTCSKCGETKPIDEFIKNENVCKICRSQYDKEYRLKNKEKIKEYRRINKDKIKKYHKEYHKKHKKTLCNRSAEYYENNKDKMREYHKEYDREYRLKNKEKIKEYRLKNKDKMREYRQKTIEKMREYNNIRYKTDSRFKLNKNISNLIRTSIKGNKNGKHWEDLVGYTLNDLKAHLEKQFTDGMNWNNYGEWHIDHIIPLSAFNFTKPKHIGFRKAWTLENLQPLWAEENLSKNAKLYYDFQGHLAI